MAFCQTFEVQAAETVAHGIRVLVRAESRSDTRATAIFPYE